MQSNRATAEEQAAGRSKNSVKDHERGVTRVSKGYPLTGHLQAGPQLGQPSPAQSSLQRIGRFGKAQQGRKVWRGAPHGRRQVGS